MQPDDPHIPGSKGSSPGQPGAEGPSGDHSSSCSPRAAQAQHLAGPAGQGPADAAGASGQRSSAALPAAGSSSVRRGAVAEPDGAGSLGGHVGGSRREGKGAMHSTRGSGAAQADAGATAGEHSDVAEEGQEGQGPAEAEAQHMRLLGALFGCGLAAEERLVQFNGDQDEVNGPHPREVSSRLFAHCFSHAFYLGWVIGGLAWDGTLAVFNDGLMDL